MYAAWTYGHGGSCGPLKRSTDGGKTWSDLLPVPANWSSVKNCPVLYRLVDAHDKARLFVFAGGSEYNGAMFQSLSEDDGETWTPFTPTGILNKVMPWCSIVDIGKGVYLAQTNARRSGDPDKWSNNIIQSISHDGGLTWTKPRVVLDMPGYKPCEPALVRSPDGSLLVSVLRENSRKLNSLIIRSSDNGETWSEPEELPSALTGDRHVFRYSPDGRLVGVFRDRDKNSSTYGHFVAWVGTCDDLLKRKEGEYKIKLLHSYAGPDCGYAGLELLPDGTFVATTYIKYRPGVEKHSIVSTRFILAECDAKAKNKR